MTYTGAEICPPNATRLERVLAEIDWSRLNAAEVEIIRSVVNPATCPLALLPWLAASLAVETWIETWSEDTKRAVIAATPEAKRIKGTRKALRLLMAALGVSYDLVEWFDATPPARHGTFKVTAWTPDAGPPLDLDALLGMRAAIRGAKPVSRVADIGLRSTVAGDIFLGGATQAYGRIEGGWIDPYGLAV